VVSLFTDVSQFVYAIDEHLGWFQILTIMSKGATNICIQVFVGPMFSFPLDKYIKAELPVVG
jgi:hypothetical protein